jgi:hypothetical protein
MHTNGDDPALEQLLGTVSEAMTPPVLVLDADTPADRAARQLGQHGSRPLRYCIMDGWSASSPRLTCSPGPCRAYR